MSTTTPNPPSNPLPWNPHQYLLFQTERNRPINDLLSYLRLSSPFGFNPTRVVDLGCGPGNSTKLLVQYFPSAREVVGVDSSGDMLSSALKVIPDLEPGPKGKREARFELGDVRTWTTPVEKKPDIILANAVLHWLRHKDRISTVVRLLRDVVADGGVVAIQMPDNYHEWTHRAMREVAVMKGVPWEGCFPRVGYSDGGSYTEERPDLDPIESMEEWYQALNKVSGKVEMWTTRYVHVLRGEGCKEIVGWVRGTGLMPFLKACESEEVREAFLREYERKLGEGYRVLGRGEVLLEYPRRFIVAWKVDS